MHKGIRGILPTPERVEGSRAFTGRGVVLAFIDAGFSNHPDIEGRVLAHVDATTAQVKVQKEVTHVTPASWHGQMTSVIAAGNGHNSGGLFRGLACESQLVLIKVSSPKLAVKESDIQRGLSWLLGHHKQYGVQVANISVGGDYPSDNPAHPLHRAVRDLVEAGVVVTIAAGNRAVNRLVPPASAPEAITVGGYNDQNTMDRRYWQSYGSSYGKAHNGTAKPEVVAPACYIASPLLPDSKVEQEIERLSTLLRDVNGDHLRHLLAHDREVVGIDPDADLDNELIDFIQGRINYHKIITSRYQHVDGTSVAAPIVASVVAQMLEANPLLTPNDVKHILIETARPVPHVPMERQGAGAVNGGEAVEMALDYLNQAQKEKEAT